MSLSRRHLGVGVGALAFAILALVSGFDRMSEQRPAFGRFVPAFMASYSQVRASADLLASGDFDEASRAATKAVRKDPMDARSMGFLGAAQLQTGRPQEAHTAFIQATRLSKREPFSQVYLFEQELAIGSYARAATRLDMFLRSINGGEMAQAMLAHFEQQAGAGAFLVEKLAGNPRWAAAYLRAEGMGSDRLRKRAAFLGSDDAGLDAIGCEPVLPMIRELARLNFRADAEQVTGRHCPELVPTGAIADADFKRFGNEDWPIGWRRQRSGDVRVTRLAGDEPRIELENRSSVTRMVLSQPVSLDEGTYRLRAKVDGPGGQDLVASLNCTTPSRPRAGRARLDREGQILTPPVCDDAVLSLWLRPGSGRVVVDKVELERVSP